MQSTAELLAQNPELGLTPESMNLGHSFLGEIKQAGNGEVFLNGCHTGTALEFMEKETSIFDVVPIPPEELTEGGQIALQHGCRAARIRIKDATGSVYIKKIKEKTFWPPDWSLEKIAAKKIEAFKNAALVEGKGKNNIYMGTTSEGIPVRFVLEEEVINKKNIRFIITAFPDMLKNKTRK
jgi:hypothetical protein